METAHQTNDNVQDELDAIENARIEKDVQEILGSLGTVEAYCHPGTDELAGWNVFDGAIQLLRNDMPVDFSGKTEEPPFVEHRQSLLITIREAYTAGLAVALGAGGNVEAAVEACAEVMDTDWHTAGDVVTATLAAYHGPTAGRNA